MQAKLQLCQLLWASYLASLEESLAAASEEVTCIKVLARDLEVGGNWDLPDLTESADLDSGVSIGGDYVHLREPCSGANKSVPSSVVT